MGEEFNMNWNSRTIRPGSAELLAGLMALSLGFMLNSSHAFADDGAVATTTGHG